MGEGGRDQIYVTKNSFRLLSEGPVFSQARVAAVVPSGRQWPFGSGHDGLGPGDAVGRGQSWCVCGGGQLRCGYCGRGGST